MTVDKESWRAISTKTKQKVLDDIPVEWRLDASKLPPENQADVTGFPRQSGLLTSEELEFTESYAVDIVGKIAKGEWKSEHVTRAFCKRAAIAHQLTNCLTVIMFNDAIKRAQELDAIFAQTGKPTGPLHGLPISLKDNFNVPGYPSSVGFCAWALDAVSDESTIVHLLRTLGAVPFVKTNVPVAMMIPETVNHCHGRTLNPLHRGTTPGGSSGGEAALIALRGSPLGVGTDIGGSLRIPAACTGLFTLRPSAGRFPNFDARSGLAGQEAVPSVHGPMARCVADLRLYAREVVRAEPAVWDPKCVDLPWQEAREDIGVRKLRVGVLWDNGMVHPTPPVARALRETVGKLREKGYEVVDWPATDHVEAIELLGKFFVADGGKSVRKLIEATGEPWFDYMKPYTSASEIGVYDMWQLQSERTALAKRMLDRIRQAGIDVILGPTTPYVSPKHDEFDFVGYTGVYNIVDYSSVSFPCGVSADREKDTVAHDFKAFDEMDDRTQKRYDANVVHGMPVSLQLTGKRLDEERLLAITERIMQDLKS